MLSSSGYGADCATIPPRLMTFERFDLQPKVVQIVRRIKLHGGIGDRWSRLEIVLGIALDFAVPASRLVYRHIKPRS